MLNEALKLMGGVVDKIDKKNDLAEKFFFFFRFLWKYHTYQVIRLTISFAFCGSYWRAWGRKAFAGCRKDLLFLEQNSEVCGHGWLVCRCVCVFFFAVCRINEFVFWKGFGGSWEWFCCGFLGGNDLIFFL